MAEPAKVLSPSPKTSPVQSPLQLAPPQPPLPQAVSTDAPPIVDGIDDTQSETFHVSSSHSSPSPTLPSRSEVAVQVRPGDLAAFSELFARFHNRIEKASAGRKYRPLRDAWDAAADEIARAPDKVHMLAVTDLVIDALRLGCESGKIVLVDACLDCIHRLFEYGHLGSSAQTSDISLDVRPGALDQLVSTVCACLEVKDEDVYLRMVQTLLTAATRTKSGLHQSTLLAAVRTVYNIFLNARTPGTRTTARVSLTQILNLVFSRMEAETAEETSVSAKFPNSTLHRNHSSEVNDVQSHDTPSPGNQGDDDTDNNPEFSSVLQRDAYLLFRALCKLSAKENVDSNSPDAVGIRSKVLSLELIRNLINNSGPAFRSGDRFVYALRQYLAQSLLINCSWDSPEVMDVSFDIFETILRKDTLRPLLKTEISALFETVIFRFLESPTAGDVRKRRALTFLSRLAADRQTMADLFLNYDCDMESSKIFERIVHVMSAAAQDKSLSSNEVSPTSSVPAGGYADTRLVALTAVIQVARSLREWAKPIEDLKEQSRGAAPLRTSDELSPSKVLVQKEVPSSDKNHVDQDVNGTDSVGSTPQESPSHGQPTASAVGVVSEGSDLDTSRFEEALKAKKDTAEGTKLFNSKPKRGIEYLVARGRLRKDSLEIAKFLHKAEDLDATMIGEYLGDSGNLNISVMHAYTDLHDFSEKTFDDALRLHLSGFRLPGEAQKIDRIMEKFASRYCECNPDIFANADAAYVLAYSTIMLHTDAHNNTIKNKMSKEEFIRNNRGINDGGDLDPSFLANLYDRITKTEIRLTGTKKDSSNGTDRSINAAAGAAAVMDSEQRKRLFEQESERIMAENKALFTRKRRPAERSTYYTASNVHLTRLMFGTAWYPTLAAVSQNLEEATSHDVNVVSLCLDGFRHGIAISSTFSMTTAKDAFVSSLAKFTHLNSISQMRAKNVECVRMILAIAAMEGNNLGEQWVIIVRAVSLLEQIRAVASGNANRYLLQKEPQVNVGSDFESENGMTTAKSEGSSPHRGTDEALSPDRPSGPVVPAVSGDTFRRISTVRTSVSSGGGGNTSDHLQRVDSKAATLATSISEAEIERIFTNSAMLSSSGVADFCGALCTVALEELGEKPLPRLYCIQKIVEMAYYNMDSRTRIQWTKIWDQMGPFFTSAMCHSNRNVAMYAIDSLRQLASKFLEKDELSNFTFQKYFLKPFETCYSRAKPAAIRELVLSCLSQIVLARAGNIKSGWKAVFAVLSLAADESVESIMNFGWQIVDSITRKYVGVLDDVFVDAVNGIAAYSRAKVSTRVSLAALDLLSGRCANALSSSVADAGNDSFVFSGDNDGHIGWWFSILTGLASAMQDERATIRNAANAGLYKVLSEHGGRFSASMWTLVFRGVLSPMFDDVRHLSSSQDRHEAAAVGEWASSIGAAVLRSVVDVFVLHLAVCRSILPDVLGLITSWVVQENEGIAREGMSLLARLMVSGGEHFENEDWKSVVSSLSEAFRATMPHEIVGPNTWKENADSENKNIDMKETSYDVEDEEKGKHGPGSGSTDGVVDGEMSATENGHTDEKTLKEMYEDGSEDGGKGDGDDDGGNEGKIDFRVVRAKCVVQLLLIELVQEVVVSFYWKLSTEHIVGLSKSLELSYSFAQRFNADIDLRYSLWRTGFMNQVPNLLKQETNGLMAYLRIMFWLYLDEKRGEMETWSEGRLLELCERVLRRYIDSCEEAPNKAEERREVTALSPVVCFIVNSMVQMSERQFESHLSELYGLLLDLVSRADDGEVRRSVARLFRGRIAPTVAVGWSSSSVSQGGKGHLPGAEQEKMLRTSMTSERSREEAEQELSAALNKVGGVRSVKRRQGREGEFVVLTTAPDEMLVAGATALSFVKTAFVERDGLLD